ncbi:MAG: hypothetical protein VYA55_07710 [Pseudomonadota bacterium]|nr:hypothetical protein [Pseudomonadota bacterium]
MPLAEIAGDLVGSASRLIGNIIVEVIFELLVKGLGYLVCRIFFRSVDPDSSLVVVVGLSAWVIVLFSAYFLYGYVVEQIEIDRCLDAGGSFNEKNRACDL